MIKKLRVPFTALTILLASATALVAIPDLAAAHSGGHDRKIHKVHNNRDDGHADHARRKKHKKNAVVCIKAPCPGDGGDRYDKRRHKQAGDGNKGGKSASANGPKKDKGCGRLILPTAGCATPTRDPVGNTRPSLPKEAKQPTNGGRQPVLESF